MTTTFRTTVIFEYVNGNDNVKTDAILEIPHRMPLEEFQKIMAIQRRFFPYRTARFMPGEYVDEVV